MSAPCSGPWRSPPCLSGRTSCLRASDARSRALRRSGSDPRRLWHLTWTLAKTEFKLAFFGSALGYLWQLMRPLLLFGVIYAVISNVIGKFTAVPFYPVSLLLGIVMFSFFSESTGGAVASLVNRENLVRKIEFPRLAVPLAIVLTALMNFCLNLIPVFIFLLAEGGSVRLSWLELPLLMLALAAFTAGLGMILSVALRALPRRAPDLGSGAADDLLRLADLHTRSRASAISPCSGCTSTSAHVMMANPFVARTAAGPPCRDLAAAYPSAATAIGGGAMILIPIGIALAAIVGGFLVFDREAPRVAEQL